MKTDADLKRLERQAMLTFFQDGLWDMFVGMFIVGWGLVLLTDIVYLGGAIFLGLYLLVYDVKRRVTYPRIGYAQLGAAQEKRRAWLSITLGIMVLAGIMMAVAFASDSRPAWLIDYFPLLFSGLLAAVVAGVGQWIGVRRFVVYGCIILGAGAVHQWTPVAWSHAFITGGGLIALAGAWVLVKFIRENPKPAEQELHDG